MAHLTCHECGKSYNYAIDESCPKCGAYNSPKGGSSTQLEGELLARSHAGRSHQQRGTKPSNQPDRRMPTTQIKTPQPNRTTPQTNAWEGTKKTSTKGKPRTLSSVIVAVVVIVLLINMVLPVLIAIIANL